MLTDCSDVEYSVPSPAPKRPRSPLPEIDELNSNKRALSFVYCFAPTPLGTTIKSIYLVNQARKRTVIVEVAAGLEMPEMREAIDREITSFCQRKCIDSIDIWSQKVRTW
jgi:hypothetical protein